MCFVVGGAISVRFVFMTVSRWTDPCIILIDNGVNLNYRFTSCLRSKVEGVNKNNSTTKILPPNGFYFKLDYCKLSKENGRLLLNHSQIKQSFC